MTRNENMHYSALLMLQYYRSPILIVLLGTFVSIAAGLMVLSSTFSNTEKNFIIFAHHEARRLQTSAEGMSSRLELLSRFFTASESVNEQEFKHFIAPLRNPMYIYFAWVTPDKNGRYTARFEDGVASTSFMAQLEAQSKKPKQVSVTYLNQPRPHTMLITRRSSSGKEKGYLLTAIDLDILLKERIGWNAYGNDARIFLYNARNLEEPIFTLNRDHDFSARAGENSETFRKLIRFSALHTEFDITSPLMHWKLLMLPTTGYMATSTTSLSIVVLFAGIIITGLLGYVNFRNTTENIRIGSEVKRKTHELAEAHQRVKDEAEHVLTILKTVLDGVITFDTRGYIHRVNPAATHIFGYSRDEMKGRSLLELISMADQGVSMPQLLSSEDGIIGTTREMWGLKSDGSVFPMEIGINTMITHGAQMAVATVRDITTRRQNEQERESLIERLEASNSELERFAYVASHDLQEPLRMISNFTQLLEKRLGDNLDEMSQKYLNIACESAKRMQLLIEDLLDYARLHEESSNNESVNCERMLDYVLMNLQQRITSTQAVITHDPLPIITCNPIRISRLLQNLIDNAIKYQTAGVAPHVHVSATDTGNEWRFHLRDNGIGMKPEYCGQIFLPFKRLHRREEYSGTGIGLAVCRKIVENFGGRIWAESQLGKGSSFYFTVPKSPAGTQPSRVNEEAA